MEKKNRNPEDGWRRKRKKRQKGTSRAFCIRDPSMRWQKKWEMRRKRTTNKRRGGSVHAELQAIRFRSSRKGEEAEREKKHVKVFAKNRIRLFAGGLKGSALGPFARGEKRPFGGEERKTGSSRKRREGEVPFCTGKKCPGMKRLFESK